MDLNILSLVVLVLPYTITAKNSTCIERDMFNKINAECELLERHSSTRKNNIGSIRLNKGIYSPDTNYNPEITLRSNPGRESSVDKSNQLKMPVFGRQVFLGSLYDATTDTIFTSMSLWEKDKIDASKRRAENPYSFSDYSSAETSYERVAKMDISASLKLSFLGGLITVSGSAKYMRDSIESNKDVSSTMIFSATTFYETLDVNTPINYARVCNEQKFKVTHVVSTIQYGMKAYFDFRREVKSSETKEVIRGKLAASIKSIPSFQAEGEIEADLEGKVNRDNDKVHVNFFGDFVLEYSPTTFEEAKEIYKTLPSLLNDQTEQSPKQEMILTPLKFYCTEVHQVLHSVGTELINEVLNMMGDIEVIKLRTNGLRRSEPYVRFGSIQHHLDTFMKALENHASKISQQLKDILPKIKEGNQNTDILQTLLENHRRSPFRKATAVAFLDIREREINIIQMIIDLSKDKDIDKDTAIQMVDYVDANDALYTLSRKYVFTFEINIFPAVGDTRSFLETNEINEDTWFNQKSALGTIRRKFDKFKKFALRNAGKDKNGHGFLVQLKRMVESDPVTLNIQRDGEEITNFIYPEMPIIINQDSTHNSFQVYVVKTENPSVVSCVIAYWPVDNKVAAKVEKNFNISNLKDDQQLEIGNLTPNHLYGYEIWYVTELGTSAVNAAKSYIQTRSISPPQNLKVDERTLSPYTVNVTWNIPGILGDRKVTAYRIQLTRENTIKVSKTLDPRIRFVVFPGLFPATTYTFSVKAVTDVPVFHVTTENGAQELIKGEPTSQWNEFNFITLPEPPETPSVDDVGVNSVEVSWTPAIKRETESTVIGYTLAFQQLNNHGDKQIGDLINRRYTQSPAKLENLMQGSTYVVKVKILTTLGNSPYSGGRIFKTESVSMSESSLEQLKEHINANSHALVQKFDSDIYIMKLWQGIIQYRREVETTWFNQNAGGLNKAVMTFHKTTEIKEQRYPLYFPQYQARFVGVGFGNNEDGYYESLPIGDYSLEETIKQCRAKRIEDSSINGVMFEYGYGYCLINWVNYVESPPDDVVLLYNLI